MSFIIYVFILFFVALFLARPCIFRAFSEHFPCALGSHGEKTKTFIAKFNEKL